MTVATNVRAGRATILLAAFQTAAEKLNVFEERILEHCLAPDVREVLVDHARLRDLTIVPIPFIRIDEKSITLQVKSGGKIVIDTKVLAQAKEEAKLELTATAVMTAKEKAGLLLSSKVLASSAGESKLQLDGDATLVGKANTSVSGTQKASFSGGQSSQIDLEAAGATISSQKTKLNGEAMTEIAGPVVKIN